MGRTPILSLTQLWVWGALALFAGLGGCGSTHPLPPYEPPLAHASLQSVRTTAYTHTESDHVAYGDHNALGGTLHAAAAPGPNRAPLLAASRPPEPPPRDGPRNDDASEGGFHGPTGVASGASGQSAPVALAVQTDGQIPATGIGSAAADWSRWPAGTVFRIANTGQVYRVDDYGWALAGRNTIDLYEPSRAAMNAWGVRRVDIEILQWGDPQESLRMLRHHQDYRHLQRMVLELEGRAREAAALD